MQNGNSFDVGITMSSSAALINTMEFLLMQADLKGRSHGGSFILSVLNGQGFPRCLALICSLNSIDVQTQPFMSHIWQFTDSCSSLQIDKIS